MSTALPVQTMSDAGREKRATGKDCCNNAKRETKCKMPSCQYHVVWYSTKGPRDNWVRPLTVPLQSDASGMLAQSPAVRMESPANSRGLLQRGPQNEVKPCREALNGTLGEENGRRRDPQGPYGDTKKPPMDLHGCLWAPLDSLWKPNICFIVFEVDPSVVGCMILAGVVVGCIVVLVSSGNRASDHVSDHA